ncbi:hypothetical protein CALCODRAFT_515344 [Calocera cornea HHB12733]|uniref:RING-type domain-containing protein n=1 Tax=Calocera cornea HHB12733 TaxID=1353952 RepID=A0A165IH85_9BASI|nr:hypothetical protein CALCODRAFT_515344 [Calocera cornea HHB12733]
MSTKFWYRSSAVVSETKADALRAAVVAPPPPATPSIYEILAPAVNDRPLRPLDKLLNLIQKRSVASRVQSPPPSAAERDRSLSLGDPVVRHQPDVQAAHSSSMELKIRVVDDDSEKIARLVPLESAPPPAAGAALKATVAAVDYAVSARSLKRKEREDDEERLPRRRAFRGAAPSVMLFGPLPLDQASDEDEGDVRGLADARTVTATAAPVRTTTRLVLDFVEMPALKRSYFRTYNPDNAEVYLKNRKVNERISEEGKYRPAPLASYVPRPNPYQPKKKQSAKKKGRVASLVDPPTAVSGAATKRKSNSSTGWWGGRAPGPPPVRLHVARMTVQPESPVRPPKRPFYWDGGEPDDDNGDDDYEPEDRPAKRRLTTAHIQSKKIVTSGKVGKPSRKAKRTSKFTPRNAEKGCHSCRTRYVPQQMHCFSCPNVYCQSCIDNRYDQEFDEASAAWSCPVCLDFCSCDKCMEKRGTRVRFKREFVGTAKELKKKTGYSLQTWLRNNGFVVEGGGVLGGGLPVRGGDASQDDQDDQPSQVEVIEILSDNDEEHELMDIERTGTPITLNPSTSPVPTVPILSTASAPAASDPTVADVDIVLEDPLFLPDTPKTPLLQPASERHGARSGRPASEEYTSDSATLITPGSFSAPIVPEAHLSSPLQRKPVSPMLVPDMGYYDEAPNDIWSGNGYSSLSDDLNVPILNTLHQSPPPPDLDMGVNIDDYLSFSSSQQ